MSSTIAPYPAAWARMIDFYPSLYYSIEVEPDVPMLEYHGHVSVSMKVAKTFKSKPTKTDLGQIKVDPVNRQRLTYKAGSFDNATTFKAKDVWREIQSILETPDVTGRLRTIVRPVPKQLAEHDLLSSEAPLTIIETSRGCYPRKMREATGLPLINITNHAKFELLERDFAKYADMETRARFRRMKSIWKTRTIVGWSGLAPVIKPLCRELTREKWHQDSIEVRGFNVPINRITVDGQIYTLHKLSRLLAI